MTTYRLFPSTSGPTTATAFSGDFLSGVNFCTTGEAWFQGYFWWLCPSGGQNTGPTKCALWQIDQNGTPHLVPGSVVTSGPLTSGWNFIPVATPFQLAQGGSAAASPQSAVAGVSGAAQYTAAVGCNGPFPDQPSFWGTPVTNGPLTAYSGSAGTLPAPYPSTGMSQGVFSDTASDPSLSCPQSPSGTDNFWVDVAVSDYSGAPAGAQLRLWPSLPVAVIGPNNDTTVAVSATAFTLTRACTLDEILMYSPAGATGLPTRCGIWDTDTQTEVPGTDNSAPSWSGAAGSGWVSVSYTGVTLAPGHYSAAYFNGSGLKIYFDSPNYFFTGTDPVGSAAVGGAGWNGLSVGGGILQAPNVANGPLLVYDNSSGTKPGQGAYQPGPTSWAYPGEFEASSDWGETRWADVLLTPVGGGSVPQGRALTVFA